MFKKTLISLAVASSLGLTGCFDSGSDTKNANPDPKYTDPAIDGKTWPIFNPATSQLPLPNDLIFDGEQGDGTFGVADSTPPVTTALNELSGASTVAPAVIQTNGQLDASTVIAGKTVHLIELEYASGDPVRALSISEPPTLAIAQGSAPVEIRADVETLDGTSAIRILPLKPLNPHKRYVVLVTTDVKDINGDSIIQDPVYSNITAEGTADNPNAGLLSSALADVRSLVNKLWEPMALAYANAAGAPITTDQIALTYAFTTSNDEKVLQYIAEPAAWFADQVATFVKVSAATAALEAGATSFEQVQPAVDDALENFPLSLPENPASPLNALFGPSGPCEIGVKVAGLGEPAVNCLGTALASSFVADLPTPLPGVNRNVPVTDGLANSLKIDNTTVKPVGLLSAVAGQLDPTGSSKLSAQGTINLPYYLGSAGADIAGGGALSWQADDELAAKMNQTFSALGLSIPQADPTVSTAVNYVFPFPKEQSRQDVPVLALYPSDGNISGAVIYQHGITTDRSAALTFGTALAAQGYAVFAIDQPLHGVAPFSSAEQQGLANALITAVVIDALLPDGVEDISDLPEANAAALQEQANTVATALAPAAVAAIATDDPVAAFTPQVQAVENSLGAPGLITGDPAYGVKATSLLNTVANAGSTIPGLPSTDGERHFNLYADATGAPAAMNFDPASAAGTDGSGSLFINLQNFLTTRDNLRQGAVDLMNLRATLFGLPSAEQPGAALPLIDANGSIVGGTAVTAATPVYFVGHSLGTITGMPFMASVNGDAIANTSCLDETRSAALPSGVNKTASANMLTSGGGVDRTLENSPAFATKILFGLQNVNAAVVQGSSSLETFLNVLQATIDTADPINFIDQLSGEGAPVISLSEVIGDTVIPNAADEAIWGVPALDATLPPEVTGLPVSITINSFDAPLAGTKPLGLEGAQILSFSGATHSTPISVDNEDVFTEMVGAALTTFGWTPPAPE